MNGLHTTTSHLFRMLVIMMLSTIQCSLFHQVGCTHRMSNPIGIGLKLNSKGCAGVMSTSWQATLMSTCIGRGMDGQLDSVLIQLLVISQPSTPCRLITNLHMILTYFCTCSQEVATPFFHVFSFKHLYTQITYFILLAFIPILHTY